MRSLIFLLLVIICFSFRASSCQLKKELIESNREDREKIKLDFTILTEEIDLAEIKAIEDDRKKEIAYSDLEIIAILKQINNSVEYIEIDNLIIPENLEILNIQKKRKEDLIIFYDYTPVLDPETFEIYGSQNTILKSKEYFIDTINLVANFSFYLSNSDTFLIRIKKQYSKKEIYSNWDTLVIK